MYPIANYVQLDDGQEPRICVEQNCGALSTIQEQPIANSMLDASCSLNDDKTGSNSFFQRSFQSDHTSRCECSNNEINQSFRQQSSGGSNYTVRHEPSPNSSHDTGHQPQGISNTSQTPRGLNWRPTSITNQSTPKPDSNLEYTNMPYNIRHTPRRRNRSSCSNADCLQESSVNSPEHQSHNVGHASHIPRSCVPKPSTYTIPSLIDNNTVGSGPEVDNDSFLFGLVRLTNNDVCYTSGTIEWVGRKRSYPVNSGFKTLNDFPGNNPINKKVRRLDNSTLNQSLDKIRECDCADMLPTVNAIVDHLNALHEAVDLIDLRLNTVEDDMSKN